MVPEVKRRRVVSASVDEGKRSSSSDAVEMMSSNEEPIVGRICFFEGYDVLDGGSVVG